MSCNETEALLDSYVDGDLPEGERDRVERHLEGCADCRRAVDEIRSLVSLAAELPREIPPRRDLYRGIRTRIERHTAGRAVDGTAARVRRVPWLGLAASILVIAIAGSTALWLRGGPDRPRTEAPSGSAAVLQASGTAAEPVDAAIRDYVEAADLLLAAIEERKGRLAPETRDVLEKNLAIIDGAIEEVRRSLEADPASRGDALLLRAMHEQKVEFLRRVSRLST